jgi:hypothetical protein
MQTIYANERLGWLGCDESETEVKEDMCLEVVMLFK